MNLLDRCADAPIALDQQDVAPAERLLQNASAVSVASGVAEQLGMRYPPAICNPRKIRVCHRSALVLGHTRSRHNGLHHLTDARTRRCSSVAQRRTTCIDGRSLG